MGNRILDVFTAEQLTALAINKLISDDCGLTDFNEGSKNRAWIEMISEITSAIGVDMKTALYKAIPIALYQGFGFKRKAATYATGFLRAYRKPAMILNYTGSGSSVLINSSSAIMSASVIGSPGDAFSLDYSTYDTIGTLCTHIDGLTNWSCTLVKDASIASSSLYQYSDKEVIGSVNYLHESGLDIALTTATEVPVPTGFSISLNGTLFFTNQSGTIQAGECSATIAAQCATSGVGGNISAEAIDTQNGLGYITGSVDGVEQVINDSSFSGGGAEESAIARKIRFSESVNALNAGTKQGIIAAVKTIDGVRDVGMRTSYPFKGTNTIVVDDGSGSISAELNAAVEKVLFGDPNDFENYPGKGVEGIGYNVVAPTVVPVSIGITVTRLSNISVNLDTIKNDVKTAIEQYINTRTLGENVLLSEIIRQAKNANAAVYDAIITSPSANVTVSENEFAKTGGDTGGTVTVTATIAVSE